MRTDAAMAWAAGRSTARAAAGLVLATVLAGCGRSGVTNGSGPPPAPSPQARRLLASLPAPYASADLANGELHFALCRSCHTIERGAPNMTGPNLYDVFGRKAASKADFSYSEALKARAAVTWDAPTLDAWLKSPAAFASGTKMTFPGIKDDADRRDVIGYLKVATSKP